jgi:predicted TIM-barrel fold metal-dependent hydrolase
MAVTLNRRCFLASAALAPWLFHRAGSAFGEDDPQASPMLDIHIHLFGIGDDSSGCMLSKEITETQTFKHLEQLLGLRERAKTLDKAYELALAELLKNSGLTKGVILAQDGVYDAKGKFDIARTQVYTPNDYLFAVTARYPEMMIPCVSINPDRADALDELNRCAEKGARILKIHPPIQGVDPGDKKHTRFFRRCAELKVMVMVHTGHEHSSPIVDIGLASPLRLELALDEGCTVVACHCGTGRPADRPDMLPDFLAMAQKYENLWGETAVLGGFGRDKDFLRLLDQKPILDRLLHGSDFPFPSLPMLFKDRLGSDKADALQSISNMIEQDLALKEALGIGRASAERSYQLVMRMEAEKNAVAINDSRVDIFDLPILDKIKLYR